jgi:hypothetical protein
MFVLGTSVLSGTKSTMSKRQEWTEESSNVVGLPRPYYDLSDKFLNTGSNSKIFKHKRLPIPWQSVPIFGREDIPSLSNPNPSNLGLILEREKRVYEEGLCGYCGVKFEDNEPCVRWTSIKGIRGIQIRSDHLPMHKACMIQGRKFCPFMQATEDFEFEQGTYRQLRVNAEPDMQVIPQGKGWS